MTVEVRLQQLSMGMSEAEIVTWFVRDGDRVEIEDDLVEVEAEKVSIIVPAPVGGIVRNVNGDAGDVLQVRDLLCVIEADG
jgi:pyruvate dehydrogenase E2 component (dihydrolipoamide acetyltransferase)